MFLFHQFMLLIFIFEIGCENKFALKRAKSIDFFLTAEEF